MRLFSLSLLLQPVPQRSLQLCPTLELFPLQTQHLICIHSSALIYVSTKQSQLWRCLLSFSPIPSSICRKPFQLAAVAIGARTHADVHTQIHARTFYANPQRQKPLCEPFLESCFSLQLHRTKYGQLYEKMVGHLLCTDLSIHLINAS